MRWQNELSDDDRPQEGPLPNRKQTNKQLQQSLVFAAADGLQEWEGSAAYS